MHIVIIALHRPVEPTGVCRHAANLARCLAQIEEITQITLVTGVWQQHYFKETFLSVPKKIKVLGIDIKNTSLSRNLWFLFSLPQLVEQLHPDLVHLSFPLPFIRSLFPCPVVSTIHDLYPYKIPDNFGYKQAVFNRTFLRQCIYNSDALACVSQTTLDDLEHYFPKIPNQKLTKVIYNLVDFDRVEPIQPEALEREIDRPFILCVGQHRKNKNFNLSIAAFAELMREGKLDSQTKLIIVGSVGPETDNLKASIAEFGLLGSVQMLSGINDRELCWLYQHCNAMVIPSSVEGFCLPLVEALHFSVKVVCSDIPIFREIGSANCIYFDLATDPVGNIARSIERVLTTTSSEHQYDCDRFSQAVIADRYFNLYLQSIRNRQAKKNLNIKSSLVDL
jgi:glycosyltransferase involved in cell wall biosynthesis